VLSVSASNPWVLMMLGALGMLVLLAIVGEVLGIVRRWRAWRHVTRCMRSAGLLGHDTYRATRYATPPRRRIH
jgi:hypothetical protein